MDHICFLILVGILLVFEFSKEERKVDRQTKFMHCVKMVLEKVRLKMKFVAIYRKCEQVTKITTCTLCSFAK